MAPLFPNAYLISQVLSTPTTKNQQQSTEQKRTPYEARTDLYPAWSVVDDAKNKASALSAEANKEFEKASAHAQATAGKIELYSPKFYAACTFGGLLACVRPQNKHRVGRLTKLGTYSHCSYPS